MFSSISFNRLPNYSIVRMPNDAGAAFPGDTPFEQESEIRNFSPEGICRVSRVQQVFSSHAGTHADQPMHFEDAPQHALTANQYSGKALLLDVSNRIQQDGLVTRAMIEDVIAQYFSEAKLHGSRVLLRTNLASQYSSEVQEMFPHLAKDVAGLLSEHRVPMVAIDTPSVDHPRETCLSGAVHGALYQARTAIVENIALKGKGSKSGEVVTFFDSSRNFEDSRGISEMLFIPSEPMENSSRGR